MIVIQETQLEQPNPRPARPEWLKVRVPGGDQYTRLKINDRRPPPPHSVRGGPLPEYGGMLERRNGDVHDPRRSVHTFLWVLCRDDRQATDA